MCIGGRLIGRCCMPPPPIGRPGQPIPAPAPQLEPPKPVPLTGVVVSTKIVDFVAEVSIHQRYENVEEVPIEAIYEFPLAEGASVCSFYAIVDGKKIEGKIKEKEQAKDQYDDAIASGHSAYLLEEVSEKKNVFKTSIGNLPPKGEVVITVVYVTELTFAEDKKLEFVLPTNTKAYPDGIVVPRFFQPTKQIVQSDKNIIVPSFGLKVDISLDMTSKIKSISSPSHPIEFNSGDTPNSASVSLANQDDVGVPLLKDFEMRIALANPDNPVFRVQDGVGMLALYPNLIDDDEDPITEMIFLVDRSGSMSGAKIQRVKDTLHIFLRSLPLGTLFNIVGFGSNFVSLFKNSKEYDDATLADATKHVNELKANLGGTSLLPPLQSIFSQPLREGIPRQIFVLTDGEVDNTQECINCVRAQSTTSRVFAFGIHGASPELVNGIAKAGEGKAEIISGNENIEGKVMVQLKRALQPALTDLKIDWGTLKAEQTPFKLPPLFSGARLIAYGYLSPDATPGSVVFTANSVKGPFRFEHQVTAEDLKPIATGITFIPKLAARSMIRDLEEGRSSYQVSSPSFNAKQKIIDLSIKSGMLSKHTAFIAVNENNKAIESEMQTRDVNKLEEAQRMKIKMSHSTKTVGMVRGGPMLFKSKVIQNPPGFRMAMPMSFSAAKPQQQQQFDNSSGSSDDEDQEAAPARQAQVSSSRSSSVAPPLSHAPPPAPSASSSMGEGSMQAPSAAQSGLKDIILQQKAAGNFTEAALNLAGGSMDKLRANTPEPLKSLPAPLLDQILITAFICGLLRTKYKDDVDQWSLVEKKAMTWIRKEAKKQMTSSAGQLASFDWDDFAAKLVK